jgi:dTDP-4-dehydrorhamnose reductase
VPDLARALLDLSRRELAGILHVAGPVPLDRYGLAVAIASAAGEDAGALRAGLASELAPERPRRIVLDSSRAAELGIRLRAPADVLRNVATEAS